VKLLFYAGGFLPIGGIEAFICDLSRVLAAHDHSIDLFCWGPDSDRLGDISRYGSVRRQRFRWGCCIFAPDWMLAARAILQQLLRHDIVILTKLPPRPLLRLLRFATSRRNYRPLVFVTPYRPQEMWRNGEPAVATLNLLDAIVVQGAGFAEDLRGLGYRGVIETIPYIPPRIAPPAALPDCGGVIRIGFIGRLVPQKNLTYLLTAFAHLCAAGEMGRAAQRSWELHLFGDGDQRQELERVASAIGLQRQVYFHGAILRDSVPAAIDRCHLFAFSSLTEGQCLAALEVLARGRPLVATPVGAFPEILEAPEFGLMAPLDDAPRFARALAQTASALIEGRLTPQAIQSRFGSLICHDRIVQQYVSFFSRVRMADRLAREA
jgi:glycosyltransferase involved in cell wall biosynthesis